MTIAPDTQAKANAAFGYLFDHPEVAAELGARLGAEWVAIGRVHKPSFFAYLKVRLVEGSSQQLTGDFAVEVKGYLKKLTERGVVRLAEQIVQTINAKAEMFQKPVRTEATAISDSAGAGRPVTMTIFRTGGRRW